MAFAQSAQGMWIKIWVSNINYSSIAEKVITGVWGAAAELLLKPVPQKQKRNLLIGLIGKFSGTIVERINKKLAGKGLPLNVSNVGACEANTFGAELEFCVTFDEIDYLSLISEIYRLVSLKYKEQDKKAGKVFLLLDKIGVERLCEIIAKSLSQKAKDDFISGVISVYGGEIIAYLNEIASEKLWGLTFVGLEA